MPASQYHAQASAVGPAGHAADQVRLADGSQVGRGHDPFPDLALDCLEQRLGGRLLQQPALVHDGDPGGGRFDIRNDVRGQDHDAVAGQVGEQVAEPDALFWIEPHGGFVDDQQLGIVQQRLGDADALFHTARIAAQRSFAGIDEVHHLEKLVDPAAGGAAVEPFDCGDILQKLQCIQVGADAKILGQVSQNGAQVRRAACDILAIPQHRAFGGTGDRGQDAHEG
jgi:hypothetical protein